MVCVCNGLNCTGVLNVLVNNVGTNRRKQAMDYTKDDFDSLFNTNVHSALHLSQLCQPLLAAAKSSTIIFNSSVAGGPLAMKSGCIYAMTKGTSLVLLLCLNDAVLECLHELLLRCMLLSDCMPAAALNQLTKNLACDWAKHGIRVNAVAPWYTSTPLANQVLQDKEYEAAVLARTPLAASLGRVAEPQEVAGT